MGFMRGLGRPIVGYTHDTRSCRDRVAAGFGAMLRARRSGEP